VSRFRGGGGLEVAAGLPDDAHVGERLGPLELGDGSGGLSVAGAMMSSVVTRLLPDLDDELTHALGQLEELLLTLSAWEDGPDAPLTLPAPLADRQVLAALQRVAAVVAPTQTRAETTASPGWGRLLGPDRRYEHLPLRLVEVDEQDLAMLADAAAVLGRELATHPQGELAEAMEAGADAARGASGSAPTPVQLVETLARVHGLLDLAITADTELLTARIAAAGRGDVVLTAVEAAAYQRIADRFNGMWALSDPLSRFLY
jgi:hypothetical protein